MKSVAAIVLACASFACASVASADQQLYEFSGFLDSYFGTNAPVDLGVGPGSAFTGFVLYDPSQFNNCQQINTGSRICATGNGVEWSVSFGSFSIVTQAPNVHFGSGGLLFEGTHSTFFPLVYQGLRPGVGSDSYLGLSDPSGPHDVDTPPADLSAFLAPGSHIGFAEDAFLDKIPHQGDSYYWNFSGTATEFKQVGVPEPDILPLLLTGILPLAWLTRRRSGVSSIRKYREVGH